MYSSMYLLYSIEKGGKISSSKFDNSSRRPAPGYSHIIYLSDISYCTIKVQCTAQYHKVRVPAQQQHVVAEPKLCKRESKVRSGYFRKSRQNFVQHKEALW